MSFLSDSSRLDYSDRGGTMFKRLKTAYLSVLTYAATTVAASAQSYSSGWSWSGWSWSGGSWNGGSNEPSTVSSVPEIDASSGLLALATIAAGLALAYEIRRRRNN